MDNQTQEPIVTMKSSSIPPSPVEARMAAGCIYHYLVSLLGEPAEGQVHRLYGDRLVEEMGKKPRKETPLAVTLKKPEPVEQLKELVRLYWRIYKQVTPREATVHADTGKSCSYGQRQQAIGDWLQS